MLSGKTKQVTVLIESSIFKNTSYLGGGETYPRYFTLCLQGTNAPKLECGRRQPDFNYTFFFLYFFFLPDVFASFSVAREHKHEILKFKENWSLWWIGC